MLPASKKGDTLVKLPMVFTYTVLSLMMITALSGCQSPADVDSTASAIDEVVELDISSVFHEGEESMIRGCLWPEDNNLILANQSRIDITNTPPGDSLPGETDIYLYDIISQEANLIPIDYRFTTNWDWYRYIAIRNKEVVGFAEGSSVVKFDLKDLHNVDKTTLLNNQKNYIQCSLDLSYVAKVEIIDPDLKDSQNDGANEDGSKKAVKVLTLHNLNTGETKELDRTTINQYEGGRGGGCVWSFDSSVLAYKIDYNRIMVYNVKLGEKKTITLDEIVPSKDFAEIYILSFTPSNNLIITTSHPSGYAMSVLKDDYTQMEWKTGDILTWDDCIGKSGDRVYADTSWLEDNSTVVSAVISYGETTDTEVVFRKDGEYFSAGAISPDGKRLAVITNQFLSANEVKQHLYIVPIN